MLTRLLRFVERLLSSDPNADFGDADDEVTA